MDERWSHGFTMPVIRASFMETSRRCRSLLSALNRIMGPERRNEEVYLPPISSQQIFADDGGITLRVSGDLRLPVRKCWWKRFRKGIELTRSSRYRPIESAIRSSNGVLIRNSGKEAQRHADQVADRLVASYWIFQARFQDYGAVAIGLGMDGLQTLSDIPKQFSIEDA